MSSKINNNTLQIKDREGGVRGEKERQRQTHRDTNKTETGTERMGETGKDNRHRQKPKDQWRQRQCM